MPKKGLNIQKRADGRWEGRYKTGRYPNGGTKFCSVYGKTRGEVTEKLLAVYSGGLSAKPQAKERTFSEILQLWLLDNRLRRKGATQYKYKMLIERHIAPELGGMKLSQISAATINAFLARQLTGGRLAKGGGLSPSYVRTMASIIQSAMQFATDEAYCPPLKSAIHKPPLARKELQILTKEEQSRLEGYLTAHCGPVSLGVLLTLYAGLRIGEVCALTWEDVDLQRSVIRVRHTVARVGCPEASGAPATRLILDSPKTASSAREIPIASALLPYLTAGKRLRAGAYVISETADFVSPRTYEYRFHRLLERCGLPKINYHALRHTFATRCVEAGMDVKSLSELLGHANVGVTLNTYVHSSIERKREQLERLRARPD